MRVARTVQSGFTLVELMVVLLIIGLLMAVAVPSVSYFREKGRRDTTFANLRALKQAIEAFNIEFNKYPKNLQELIKPPQGMPPLIEAKGGQVPKDGWGNDFVYKVPGKGKPYDLYSYGSKGPEEATPEDYISVWTA